MDKLRKSLFWLLHNWEEGISTIAAAVMLIVCSANVFSRYLLKNSIVWAQDVCIICLIYIAFVGAAAAYKRNGHYGMDFLVEHLPVKAQYALKIVIQILLTIVFAYLTYLSVVYTVNARKLMNMSRIPYKCIDLSAVLGFGSMTIYSVAFLIEGFFKPKAFKKRFIKSGEEEEE